MKAHRIWICFLFMLFCSCSKFESEVSLGQYRITYRVVTESGDWFGTYLGLDEEICLCEAPYQPGDWSYTFTSNNIPSKLSISATSELFDDSGIINKPDVTVSIYINGELMNIQTNSIADGKANATYPATSDFLNM